MEKLCIYPEQGAEVTAYERALNCLIFMLVYFLAGILCMFFPVIFGIHVWHIGWCVAAGSFFWTAILLWKKRSIYEEQVTEMTNSVIAIEDETLRCYQAVGNVYESCWIHFSDIMDVIFNKKKQAFLIQITEDQKRKSEICVNSILVEENLFEVRGGNYNRQEFLAIFQRIIPYAKSAKDIDIALVEKQWAASVRSGRWSKIIPWLFWAVIFVIQIIS